MPFQMVSLGAGIAHTGGPKNKMPIAQCSNKRPFLQQLDAHLNFPLSFYFSLFFSPTFISLNSLIFLRTVSCGLMGKHNFLFFYHVPICVSPESRMIITHGRRRTINTHTHTHRTELYSTCSIHGIKSTHLVFYFIYLISHICRLLLNQL